MEESNTYKLIFNVRIFYFKNKISVWDVNIDFSSFLFLIFFLPKTNISVWVFVKSKFWIWNVRKSLQPSVRGLRHLVDFLRLQHKSDSRSFGQNPSIKFRRKVFDRQSEPRYSRNRLRDGSKHRIFYRKFFIENCELLGCRYFRWNDGSCETKNWKSQSWIV